MADIKGVIEKLFKDKKGPLTTHKLTFQSDQAQLEPIYYWFLDFIQDGGWETKKLIDNFMASPGSGQFQDMMQKATNYQSLVTKTSGDLHNTIKSALNIIYDLKEFEERLSHYKDYENEDKKDDAMLTLKQIWLDNVDIKKGNGSIHSMATTQMGFVTVREIFMKARDTDDVKDMAKEGLVNESVKRIVIPRIKEFLAWVEYSGKELNKRMQVEKSYLKTQIETIKLYSSWLKPYMKASEELRQQGFEGNASLVNAFSTSLFELTLIGKKDQKLTSVIEKGLNKKKKDKLRKYHSIILVDIKYRGHVSQRVTQKGDYGFAFGGRIDMTFDSYAFNEEELSLIEKKTTEDDVYDSMKFSLSMAEDSLKELKEDLDYFLKTDEEKEKEDKKKRDEEKEKNGSGDINPFSALASMFGGIFKSKDKKDKKKDKKEINDVKDIKKDDFHEKELRKEAEKSAISGLYLVYDIYKKSHGMASSPQEFDSRT